MPGSQYPIELFEIYESSETRVEVAIYDSAEARGPRLTGRVLGDVLLHCQDAFGWSLADMQTALEERLAEDPVRTEPGHRHLSIVTNQPKDATWVNRPGCGLSTEAE